MSSANLYGHREQLDGLRFLAFLSVFISHSFEGCEEGALGVPLFYALSGFLITRILLLNQSGSVLRDLGVFYARRIIRIFPLYYAYILGCMLFWGQLSYPVWHFLYLQNTLSYCKQEMIGQPHLWSLCVEEQFYLLYPLVLLMIPASWRCRAILSLIAMSIAATVFLDHLFPTHGFLYALLPTSAQFLMWGCLAGLLDLTAKQVPATALLVLGALLLVTSRCLFHTSLVPFPGRPVWFMAIAGVSFSLIVFGLWRTQSRPLIRLFALSPVAYLGKISYGLYVYHICCLMVARWLVVNLDIPGLWRLRQVIAFLLTVGLAALSWHLYESPLNNLKRYFRYRQRVDTALPWG